MNYKPSPEQESILNASDDTVLVIGGAGTGKTTTAAAKARLHLEERRTSKVPTSRTAGSSPADRVLFLSFSRSSVARILDRSRAILGPYAAQVEVTTFHALAWNLIRRFGSLLDLPSPYLLSSAQAKLFSAPGALKYSDLVPKAIELMSVPAVARHLSTRWSLVICDEFQDTDDKQWELIQVVRGDAQLLLLGDPHQCIYANLPGAVGVSPARIQAVRDLPGTKCIELPEASFRDPTGVIPAAAASIRRRDFSGPAIRAAMAKGMLHVHHDPDPSHEAGAVALAVQELEEEGLSVAIFSHHNDALADLSDQLRARGIDHEITGLSESLTAAIEAQLVMAKFATGGCKWEVVLQYLAIFITSAVRGKNAPDLALQVLGKGASSSALDERLITLQRQLAGETLDTAVAIASRAHGALGLPSKSSAWSRASTFLSSMVATARHQDRTASDETTLAVLDRLVDDRRSILLTEDANEPEVAVQLMNLHQTKGREADATVVVLRGTDFFGFERVEPYEEGSRLLYVVFSRARKRIIVLTFGDGHSGLVSPFVSLNP